jgi:glycogen debranching enzyme
MVKDQLFDDQHSVFFIPANTSLSERRPRTLKQDDTFAVFDQNGDALSWPGSPEGIYYHDTRHLALLYLTIEGSRPILLSSTLRDDNASLTCDLTNPDLLDANGNLRLEHDLVHLRRSRFLWNATCFERLSVANYDVAPHTVRVELGFATDFAGLFEVRRMKRTRRGQLHEPMVAADAVRLTYTGLHSKLRATDMRFEPAPKRLTAKRAEFEFSLSPRERRIVFIEIRCGAGGQNESLSGSPRRHWLFVRRWPSGV